MVGKARFAVLVLLLALPWLWPFTLGPTSATEPWLVALAAAAALLVLWPDRVDVSRHAHWIATGWLAAALVSGAIGLVQYFDLEAPLFPWVDIARPGQAFANLRQTNQLATLLAIGLLALGWLARNGRVQRGLAVAMAALLITALAATASRTGLVQLLVLALLAVVWSRAGAPRWRAWRMALAALSIYLVAALLLPWLARELLGIDGRSVLVRMTGEEIGCSSRLVLWRNVLHLIALRPWLGWGWGELDYAHYITLYDGPRFCEILDNAHNLPLQLAVELGVPVAIAVCGAVAWWLWRSRPWREREAARQLAWGVLLVIGLHSLLEYPLWYGPFQIAALLSLWLLWATRRGGKLSIGPWLAGPRRSMGVLLLAAAAFAGWDYWRVSQVFLPEEARAAAWRSDPLAAARASLFFRGAARFAEVTTRTPTRDNAAWMLPAAERTLHFSPEPSVIVRVIEAAALLGKDELVLAHLTRFKAAFPAEWQRWSQDNARIIEGARALRQGAAGQVDSAR